MMHLVMKRLEVGLGSDQDWRNRTMKLDWSVNIVGHTPKHQFAK